MTKHWKHSYQELSCLSIKITYITMFSFIYIMEGLTAMGWGCYTTALHLKINITF